MKTAQCGKVAGREGKQQLPAVEISEPWGRECSAGLSLKRFQLKAEAEGNHK